MADTVDFGDEVAKIGIALPVDGAIAPNVDRLPFDFFKTVEDERDAWQGGGKQPAGLVGQKSGVGGEGLIA